MEAVKDLEIQAKKVFDYWNNKSKDKKWRTHTLFGYALKSAILKILRQGYPVEYICGAIDNYASLILASCGVYKWTYSKWGLFQFLTRGARDGDYRWLWFAPDTFREADWITDSERDRRIEVTRQKYKQQEVQEKTDNSCTVKEFYQKKTFEELQTDYKKPFCRRLVEKYRPDFVETLQRTK